VYCVWVLFLVCACSARGGGAGAATSSVLYQTARYESSGNAAPGAAANTASDEASDNFEALGDGNTAQTRKLVKTADLRIRVEDLGAMEKLLAELIEKYDAWTAWTGIYENSRNYSIRVPSGSYDAMLAELVGMGRILRHTTHTEDVTLRYYDLESRLATRRELLRTYQSYLSRAANIDEIMTVESRIADLQQEIDQTGTQFRNLANLVDYSTINVDITGPVNAASHSRPSLGERTAELFGSFGEVVSSALVVLIGIIIYGVPGILIIICLYWLLFGRIGIMKKLWRLASGKK